MFEAGTIVGPYEIIARLGVGGMGEVYRARDTRLGREVAFKVLPHELSGDRDRLRRFEQEARSAGALNHPNVLAVYDVGSHEGAPYIVTELLQGETLRSRINAGDLTVRKALDIAVQIAHGLAAAHEKGIVHRDLKPTNLFITGDGRVKILDFGLAKLARPERSTNVVTEAPTGPPDTAAGAVLGTVGYMAPEQVRGLVVDERADIFAFGCVLYEMLTGRRAFSGATPADTQSAILREDPPPISRAGGAVPAPLHGIVGRCLEKRPEDRFRSAHDLALALEIAGGGVSALLSRVVGSGAARRWVIRVGLVLGAALAAGVATITVPSPVRETVRARLGLLPLPQERRVAVLPFHCEGSEEERALCNGLGDYVTARLGQLERLQQAFAMIPASEVRSEGVASAEAARRALGATLVVTGSLQRTGDVSVLSVSLVDTVRRRQVRATTDRWQRGTVAFPDRLVDDVVRLLELEVTPEAEATLRAGVTGVAEAATLYTKGLAYTPYTEASNALQRYDQQHSLERAISLFSQALARDPNYALAMAGLGEAYWRLYDLTKRAEYVELAERQCLRALAADDLLARVWVTLGVIHAGTGKEEVALEDFQHALDRDPANADARREMGGVLRRLGRFDEAEAAYRRAIELRPDDWRAYSGLANLLRRRGRTEAAVAEVKRALELVPDNARLWSNLGVFYFYQDRKDDAKRALQRSVDLHPTASAVSNLATLQFFDGEYAAAARTLERATRLGERDYRLWRNLGAAYYWAPGERERAPAAYRKAIALAEEERRLDPGNPVLLADLADCYAMTSDAGQARALGAEALRLAPANADVALTAAGVYEHLGDRDAALRWLAVAMREGTPRDTIEKDPTFEKLRADPRFAKLAKAGSSG
jgi:tetratricopeptide (TPR) repeat protein/TolB-like protein